MNGKKTRFSNLNLMYIVHKIHCTYNVLLLKKLLKQINILGLGFFT